MPFNKGDFTQQGVAGHVNANLRLNEKRLVNIDMTSNENDEGCTIVGAVTDLLNNEVYTVGSAPSGKITITENGNDINIARYRTADVNVSGNFTIESGTWSPSEDESSSIIPFTDTHTDPPFFYVIRDTTSTESSTTRDNGVVTYVNFEQYFGTPYIVSSELTVYGLACTRYKSSATSTSGTSYYLSTPYTDTTSTATSNSQFWATSSGIKLTTSSENRLNRTSRTFSWMAMWKNS